jgi:hypothetical protein
MKYLFMILVFGFLIVSTCPAQETAESLQKEIDAANGQKDSGILLTVSGGVVLAGSLTYFIYDYVNLLYYLSANSSDSAVLSRVGAWLGISISGFVLGAVGLGVGIPYIIVGAIREKRARNQMEEMKGASQVSIEPILSVNPVENNVLLGLKFSY